MAERSMKNQGPKHIRTSGACKACRSRKQKCSGDRPQCVRCHINDIQCQWPEPRKRGPPKHYTAIIEKRLLETEAILFALMSQVSDEQLMSAYDYLQQDRQSSANLDEPSDAGNRHGLTRKDKLGLVYWGNYPLNSAQDARRWWADRMSTAANESPSRQNQVIGDALIEINVASEHGETTLQDADTSEFRSDELSPCVGSVESPVALQLPVTQQDDCGARVGESSREESILSMHQEAETRQFPMTHLEQTPTRSTGYQNSRHVGGYESAYLW
ncbi:hypothetical protein CDV31_009959 [Fusarium ambrosium]|uniref:Zn(2)-C6 fungal-type domain-containing protein n=1 Tax=Fusarium ambrosium TaxID=131363 RepID=A0A428TRK4_9HYPO|nr:hypothetical protein CDV31_009959 [Fusarium ambrosium]